MISKNNKIAAQFYETRLTPLIYLWKGQTQGNQDWGDCQTGIESPENKAKPPRSLFFILDQKTGQIGAADGQAFHVDVFFRGLPEKNR